MGILQTVPLASAGIAIPAAAAQRTRNRVVCDTVESALRRRRIAINHGTIQTLRTVRDPQAVVRIAVNFGGVNVALTWVNWAHPLTAGDLNNVARAIGWTNNIRAVGIAQLTVASKVTSGGTEDPSARIQTSITSGGIAGKWAINRILNQLSVLKAMPMEALRVSNISRPETRRARKNVRAIGKDAFSSGSASAYARGAQNTSANNRI